eukprot:jgi/Bigna1/45731/e_gw1.147.9.1
MEHLFKTIRKYVRLRTFPSRIKKVVLTAPLRFSAEEKQKLKEAATKAGFEVLKMISCPVAAAIGAELDKRKYGYRELGRTILVFDLGGRTLDVTILRYFNGSFSILATAGSDNFGGVVFDELLAEDVLRGFKEQNRGANPMKDTEIAERLLRSIAKTKELLSTTSKVPLVLESFFERTNLNCEVKRSDFERTCENAFLKIFVPLGKVLDAANLTAKDINHVVLSGGSSRIPKVIQEHLREFFAGHCDVDAKKHDPSTIVGIGAAIQAAVLLKPPSTPLRIGIEAAYGEMVTIVPQDSELPTRFYRRFTTHSDGQERVAIKIYEGERPKASQNRFLGGFELGDLPSTATRGKLVITIAIKVSESGEVTATAVESQTKNEASAVLDGHMASEREANEHKDRLVSFEQADTKREERIDFIRRVEEMVYELKHNMVEEEDNDSISEVEQQAALRSCEDFLEWIRRHPKAKRDVILGRLDKFKVAVGTVVRALAGEKEDISTFVEID